ncbi:MAG TPA: hypothetical protein VFG50_05390 [Rhodothermales bacterium]|nr:hypothetical protein [Rhodothermales bacterium]
MRFIVWSCVLAGACLVFACDSGPEPGPVRKQVVYFSSDRGGGRNMNIWRMDPDGENLRQVTHYAKGDYWPADVSPDGQRLLFFRLDDYTLISSIYLMDVGGPEPSLGDAVLPGLSAAGNFFPDGQRFIYDHYVHTSDSTGNEAALVYDLRTRQSIQISPPGFVLAFAQVSPDGDQVCFSAFGGPDQYATQTYLLNLGSGAMQRLTPAESGRYTERCRFSPAGDKVFFSMRGNIFWADLPGGALHDIPRLGIETWPSANTSGSRVFFRQGGGYRADSLSEIMSINLDGSGLKRLTNDMYRDDKPVVDVIEVEE